MVPATSLPFLKLSKHQHQNPPHNDPKKITGKASNYQQHPDVAEDGMIRNLNNFIRENQ
jgi:hypothetical protein